MIEEVIKRGLWGDSGLLDLGGGGYVSGVCSLCFNSSHLQLRFVPFSESNLRRTFLKDQWGILCNLTMIRTF